MTGPDDVPDADDSSIDPDALRSQLQRQLAEVAEQKALLDRVIAYLEKPTERPE